MSRLNLVALHQDGSEFPEERSRISRAIHDELGQMLTDLKMDLVWLQKRLARDREPLLDKTKAMSKLIDACVQSVRQISTELRPRILLKSAG